MQEDLAKRRTRRQHIAAARGTSESRARALNRGGPRRRRRPAQRRGGTPAAITCLAERHDLFGRLAPVVKVHERPDYSVEDPLALRGAEHLPEQVKEPARRRRRREKRRAREAAGRAFMKTHLAKISKCGVAAAKEAHHTCAFASCCSFLCRSESSIGRDLGRRTPGLGGPLSSDEAGSARRWYLRFRLPLGASLSLDSPSSS